MHNCARAKHAKTCKCGIRRILLAQTNVNILQAQTSVNLSAHDAPMQWQCIDMYHMSDFSKS